MFEMSLNDHVVSTDRIRLDLDKVHRWLAEESYWAAGIPREMVNRAVANSLPFGLYDPAGTQVGFARVTTDYATHGYVQDVFIDKGQRGRGLGRLLIRAVFAHPDLQDIRRWLLTTRDAHRFYARFGFTPLACPEDIMESHGPGVRRLPGAAFPEEQPPAR